MDKTKKDKKVKKINPVILDCVFLAVLIAMPFLHLAFGVEFTDTAYSLGNYENLDNMNMTWTIATFWANILGKFFTTLPYGHTWIGMKFYTTLVPVASVVISYLYLKKYMPRVIVFLGELLAVCMCWCPTTILYNYLTYFLFNLAIIVLIESLMKERKYGLFLAGIILAFNVFVRFPNITEVLLIMVVWLNAKTKKEKFLYGLLDTLICIGGFACGVVLNVLIIGLKYGFTSIPDMIVSLFSMTGENTGYKPVQMLLSILRAYTAYTKSFILLAGITVLCFAVSALMKKHFARIIAIVAQFILYGGFLYWAYTNKVFTVRFDEYSSMYFWMVILFIICLSLSIWTLLRKRREREYKLLTLSAIIVISISPLGSNNALYPSINNLFIVAPTVVFLCYNELFKGRNIHELLDLEAKNSMVSTRITVLLLGVSIFIHSLLFGFTFIFRDSGFPNNNRYEIKGNEVLVGMHTNPERKGVIENLTQYVKDNDLEGNNAIFYGDIPGLEYILKMPCAISHTWPDLGSFSYEEFTEDIDSLNDTPVIFVNESYCEDILNPEDTFSQKDKYLSKYMNDNDYTLKIKIENIAVYTSGL